MRLTSKFARSWSKMSRFTDLGGIFHKKIPRDLEIESKQDTFEQACERVFIEAVEMLREGWVVDSAVGWDCCLRIYFKRRDTGKKATLEAKTERRQTEVKE